MIQFYLNEAWCARCHVSHPPGTKRCLHCGGSVMPARPVEGMRSQQASVAHGPSEIPRSPDLVAAPEEAEAEESAKAPRPFRIGIATVWVVLAVIGTILRACAERE